MRTEEQDTQIVVFEPVLEASCGSGLLEIVDPHPLLLAFVAFAALW